MKEIEGGAEPTHDLNIDMKIDARRWRVYSLWLYGKTQSEIAEIERVDRTTIWNDLNAIREQLENNPQPIEQIRQETLLSLRIIRNEALQRAETAPDKEAHKFFKIAANIDQKILERFDQSTDAENAENQETDNAVKTLTEYMVEKYGPENLLDFEEWYQRRLTLDKLRKSHPHTQRNKPLTFASTFNNSFASKFSNFQ